MNQKQKCFYTALGAAIMLIGIGVGAIICPPLIAQRESEVANRVSVHNQVGSTVAIISIESE